MISITVRAIHYRHKTHGSYILVLCWFGTGELYPYPPGLVYRPWGNSSVCEATLENKGMDHINLIATPDVSTNKQYPFKLSAHSMVFTVCSVNAQGNSWWDSHDLSSVNIVTVYWFTTSSSVMHNILSQISRDQKMHRLESNQDKWNKPSACWSFFLQNKWSNFAYGMCMRLFSIARAT